MSEPGKQDDLVRGIVAILLIGVVLGLGYNWFGLNSRRPFGVAWIATDKTVMPVVDLDGAVDGALPASSYSTDLDDPMAIPTAAVHSVPEIPAIGRPVQIQLGAVKAYFDAKAALIVDAREADEFAEGHILGAINLPYEQVVSDPARLESLDTGGRPIITYCGGGGCEVSISLAEELFYAGHERVAVYMGGYPSWTEADYPIEEGL